MNLTIVQSILHGALRPNLVDNIDFRHLANLFSKLPNTLLETENLFLNNFSFLLFDFDNERPFNIGEIASDSYTPIREEYIGKKLDLMLPPFSSPKEKFYQVIVEAEIHRIKLAIINYAAIQHSDIDTRKTITDTLKVILQYAKQVEPEADSTLSALRVQLICFYVEMVAIALPLLTQDKDYLSFEDLIYELFSRYPNDDENDKYKNFVASLEDIFESDTLTIEKQIVETSPEIQILKTKYDVFMRTVERFNFMELPKLKSLPTVKRKELVMHLVKSVPFAIAMLEFLEYPQYLKEQYTEMNTKEALYRHIAKALDVNHDTAKGQFLAYNNPNSMKAINYTSYQYKEEVSNFYNILLCK